MEFHVEAGPKTRRFIEAVLPSMLTQLGLNSSRRLLMIKTDRELTDHGTTIPMVGIDTILVVLKPRRNLIELGVTLAHELVHVRQLAKGILQMTPRGKKWRGKFYSRRTPYLDQPWEQEAFARQEIIFRRAID
jgi:hypothetical protein